MVGTQGRVAILSKCEFLSEPDMLYPLFGKEPPPFDMTLTVSAFYKFVEIAEPAGLRPGVLDACSTRNICGSILLAPEGINGTISGGAQDLAEFFDWLRIDPRFTDLETKESPATAHPFKRLKVRLKREIVTLDAPEANPTKRVGAYVEPEEWNKLIENPDVVLVDTRNAYEVNIGTFPGAINPKTRAFRHFPHFVKQTLDPVRHPKVAMFCTGGIRCEKASSYLLAQGFKEVYHLRGGILKYLETVPPEESLWQGECFVFDERVALTHGVAQGSHGMCRDCGEPVPFDPSYPTPAGEIRCQDCATAAAPMG